MKEKPCKEPWKISVCQSGGRDTSWDRQPRAGLCRDSSTGTWCGITTSLCLHCWIQLVQLGWGQIPLHPAISGMLALIFLLWCCIFQCRTNSGGDCTVLFLPISDAVFVAPYFEAAPKVTDSSHNHQEVHLYAETHFCCLLHPVSPSVYSLAWLSLSGDSFSPAPGSGTLLCPVTSHTGTVCSSCASTGHPELVPALARWQRQNKLLPRAFLSSYWAFQMPAMPKQRRKLFSGTVLIQEGASVA